MDAVSVVVFGLIGLACVAVIALLSAPGGRAASREHMQRSLDPHQHISHVLQVPFISPSDFSGPGTGGSL